MKRIVIGLIWTAIALPGFSQTSEKTDGKLGAGDAVRVTVFQQPDLTTEARITEKGTVPMPLLGEVKIAGMTQAEAAAKIAGDLQVALKNQWLMGTIGQANGVQAVQPNVHGFQGFSGPGTMVSVDPQHSARQLWVE